MPKAKLYFDNPEGAGPSRETSHPNFVKALTEEFYYDCADEFSPFGNDDGADTLFNLEDWYRENGHLRRPMKFLKELVEDNWGFDTKYMKLTDKAKLLKVNEEEAYMFDTVDHAIIATAFGQYKIEGAISTELKELANIAIARQKIISQNQIDTNEMEVRKLVKIVDDQTTKPDENGGMNTIFKNYLNRLDKMNVDLNLIP